MQVSHAADHITHAMIGGAKTIEFGISNDAAFFNILSSTLYSDQRLAVAREVLCNGWDAHIRAKKEDVAIVVNISDAKLVVRDFGSGIHPDMMGPLYGTYGGSDKKNNGTETGGFGLGCKSPFAYGDHFEVISWHEGVKTIYNLSKSSADKMGKPGITTIVAVPCGDETGLQVTIPVKNPHDRSLFEQLFKRVAFNGEMNVIVNGDLCKGLPLSKAEHNWIITNVKPLNGNHRIYVRYGNVIYPVESNAVYNSKHQKLCSFLDMLEGRTWASNYNIIFQALPDTIAVTPSRESLSMQEHTINTLKGLIEGFFKQDYDKAIAKESIELLDRQILKCTEDKLVGELMTSKPAIPGLALLTEGKDLPVVKNVAEMATQYTRRTYPKDPDFYRRDMGLRIEMAIELGVGKRGHLNQVKHQATTPREKLGYRVKGTRNNRVYPKAQEWFKKAIIRPLARDMQAFRSRYLTKQEQAKASLAHSKQPYSVLEFRRLFILKEATSYRWETGFVEPHRFHRGTFEDYLPILRNIVVITFSRKDLVPRIRSNPEIKAMGGPDHIWVYHAPVAKTRLDATRDFFTKKGFKVIDLTVAERETWDIPKPFKAPVDPNKPKKVKAVGYPALRGAVALNKQSRIDNCFDEGSPRVTKPTFFLHAQFSRAECRPFELGMFKATEAYILTKLFGDVCAVVRTEPQAKKLKEEGLMQFNEYVVDYITKQVSTSPSFIAYWEEDLNRALGSKDGKLAQGAQNELLTAFFDLPEVRKAMGLKKMLNDHDLMVLSLWRALAHTSGYYKHYAIDKGKNIADASKAIELLPISQSITDVTQKLAGNPFIGVLNLDEFQTIARKPNAKANGHLDRLAKLVKIALAG